MMRYLYSFLFYLILPALFIRLLWRSRKNPAYRQRLPERLGFYPFKLDKSIWVHAVSMGESIAAKPLVEALLAQYPGIPLVMTTMTITGAAQVKKQFGDRVQHAFIPYDVPDAVNRFLRTINPCVGIIMETEIWPNLLAIAQQRNIPICLLNARLSEKSARGYQHLGMTKTMLSSFACIAAHAEDDANRFIALGAPVAKVVVTGSIKFDLQVKDEIKQAGIQLRKQLGEHRFVWIAASTHTGEEEKILAAHQALRKQVPDALLILVPRHPERFNEVAVMCSQLFPTVRRSDKRDCPPSTGVYLGDTMGEMMIMYNAADVAFVGGSFVQVGGHNLLEPAALAKPVLSGPILFNFTDISRMLLDADALKITVDAEQLSQQLITLAQDKHQREQLGQRALNVVAANRGALEKQLNLIQKFLHKIEVPQVMV